MKKRMTSILAGLTTVVLTLSLCTTALAAPAGKKAADETGKTASQVSKTVPGRTWQREFLEGYLYYIGPAPAKTPEGEQFPAFRPTWLPEGYSLAWASAYGTLNDPEDTPSSWWIYGSDRSLSFTCYLRPCGGLGSMVGASVSGDSVLYRTKVQGYDADFYQGDEHFGNNLIWENKQGNLFCLSGHLDRATLEKVAESVTEVTAEPLPEYALSALPTGSRRITHSALPEYVHTLWALNQPGSLAWTYSTFPLNPDSDGTAKTVKVNGGEARFWQGEKKAVTHTSYGKDGTPSTISREACYNTLLWTDSETGVNFLLKGHLDEEVLIYMAEHITLKPAESAQ